MNKKDKVLIKTFVEKIKDMDNLECILLFGSMARGEADRRSDIDILLVFKDDHPKTHLHEITKIITSLKPHREIKPIVTNLVDYDEEFFQTVLREGKLLWGKLILSTDQLLLQPYHLVSYQTHKLKPAKKVKISRLIHGYHSKKTINGEIKQYTYKGLKHKYNIHFISKGTILIPENAAKSFFAELKKYYVGYTDKKIWM